MRRILITTFILSLIVVKFSNAATIYSNGTGGGDWEIGSSWLGGTTPTDGDLIIIQSTDIITIDGTPDITLANVLIIIEGTLNITYNVCAIFPNPFDDTTVGNLYLTGTSGIRLDGSGQIVESIPSPGCFGILMEGFGTITLDGDVIWAACQDDPPILGYTCEDYVSDNNSLYPDGVVYGDISGDGVLLPATNNPLPIELLSFSGKVGDNKVLLSWITATEINNDFFTLERSIDGLNFYEITTVSGAGNSSEKLNYSYTDKNPFFGISYYRLKQTDYDGQFTYSNIIAIKLDHGLQELDFRIYPNPTKDVLKIQITGNAVLNLNIELYNALGERVDHIISSRKIDGFELIVENLKSGIYMVHLINENYRGIRKFVKE